MKVEKKTKKGLRTSMSVIIDKSLIKNKLEDKLKELQTEVNLKGFRPGKVPQSVIKSQFGKSIYGEVIDKLLQESSMKAIKEKGIKIAGQPKIDLKTFGEGKDLVYEMQVDSLPEVKLKTLENIKATEFKIKIEKNIIDEKIKEIANQHKNFIDKKDNEKSEIGNQITFDYNATVDSNKFEGSDGKGVQIELGKDLFLKGFDEQLVGLKKNDIKSANAILPENHPKKELANKKAIFECKILNVKKSAEAKLDDNFATQMGAKDFKDLENLIESQISSQYKQALDSITKKEILDQVEKNYNFDLPKNLIENELSSMTKQLKKEEVEKHKVKNEKLASSRIKLGLILNEYGEQNKLKVNEDEVRNEIQKQIKGMPGQEKMVLDYYQKNPQASQSLRGALYEEKIISLLKSKIKLSIKDITTKEAEKIISNFNNVKADNSEQNKTKSELKSKVKSKKISKK